MTPTAKARLARALAREAGFDLVGVTRAAPLPRAAYYRDWLAAGHAGSMGWLRRNVPLRLDPGRLLPGARAILCVGLNYRRADGFDPAAARSDAGGPADPAQATGRIAQYARGRDYHAVLHGMLGVLAERLRSALAEPFAARAFVDTGPLLERELAARAGLGWIGRNTCLLNPRLGSYLFLGELVTTLDLPADDPLPDRCGSCRRCLQACPTGALIAPYQMDASRCISYLTIEHHGPIPPELQAALRDCLYGCDICQQVCPYNAKAPIGTQHELAADRTPPRLPLAPLVALRSGDYRRLTRDTALRRASRNAWRRNALAILSRYGDSRDAVQQAT